MYVNETEVSSSRNVKSVSQERSRSEVMSRKMAGSLGWDFKSPHFEGKFLDLIVWSVGYYGWKEVISTEYIVEVTGLRYNTANCNINIAFLEPRTYCSYIVQECNEAMYPGSRSCLVVSSFVAEPCDGIVSRLGDSRPNHLATDQLKSICLTILHLDQHEETVVNSLLDSSCDIFDFVSSIQRMHCMYQEVKRDERRKEGGKKPQGETGLCGDPLHFAKSKVGPTLTRLWNGGRSGRVRSGERPHLPAKTPIRRTSTSTFSSCSLPLHHD
ncbi:hypothetical protein B0T20DRAFT_394923 [Sordaria brevicollis]|uniref:Uncharacterized protein n=1 Tax=Sordaria brevicollis TaxID=83679 RepID=A0AAE0U9Z0_SORBR|nr:hypothetical protein B0T20DRAFT_394923 [Sordaria brevicollis]